MGVVVTSGAPVLHLAPTHIERPARSVDRLRRLAALVTDAPTAVVPERLAGVLGDQLDQFLGAGTTTLRVTIPAGVRPPHRRSALQVDSRRGVVTDRAASGGVRLDERQTACNSGGFQRVAEVDGENVDRVRADEGDEGLGESGDGALGGVLQKG